LDAEQRNADDAAKAEEEAGAEDKQQDPDENVRAGVGLSESEEPLSEQQQAIEQWLRQIPDDPAGLLRNKLEQSHRLEYPGVQSSDERW